MCVKTLGMRVLFSGLEWFPDCRDGGLDRYFFEQLRALSGAGVGGEALVSAAHPTNVGEIAVKGMAEPGAWLWKRWRGARRLAGRALQDGVDLVNSHFALYIFPWLRKISSRTALVVNFHGPWAEEMRVQAPGFKRRMIASIARQIELRVYRRADRLIVLSHAFRKLASEQYGIPTERIRVIPGGLDLGPYAGAPERAEARRRLGWPVERTILLAVRRLAKRMGLDLLIEAVAELRREFPELLLMIGGKGEERSALQALAERHGAGERVQFLGYLPEPDLPLAYAAADCAVVPTVALEGFGLITVESMAAGTPVLGTRVGATPEILEPLDANLLFEAPTAAAMVGRLRQVLRGELRLPDRAACRAHVARYAWTSVTPKILEVYREALAGRRERA